MIFRSDLLECDADPQANCQASVYLSRGKQILQDI